MSNPGGPETGVNSTLPRRAQGQGEAVWPGPGRHLRFLNLGCSFDPISSVFGIACVLSESFTIAPGPTSMQILRGIQLWSLSLRSFPLKMNSGPFPIVSGSDGCRNTGSISHCLILFLDFIEYWREEKQLRKRKRGK